MVLSVRTMPRAEGQSKRIGTGRLELKWSIQWCEVLLVKREYDFAPRHGDTQFSGKSS